MNPEDDRALLGGKLCADICDACNGKSGLDGEQKCRRQ
jgi:hypothetical protein